MESILETLTEMKFIEGVYMSMVENKDSDVGFMNNDYLFKLVDSTWLLKKKERFLEL